MCLIIAKKKGVDFDIETISKAIKTGIKRNNDGAGFAVKYNTGKHPHPIYISKGYMSMEPTLLINAIKDCKITKEDELIVHLRYSTAGKDSVKNCHPFGVPDKYEEEYININDSYVNYPVVAHNGTFYDFVTNQNKYFNSKEEKSDSLKFVEEILVKRNLLPIFVDKANKDDFFFDSYILDNKLAFLLPKKEMFLVGNFIKEDDGMMYSNEYYKTPFKSYSNLKWDSYYAY